MYIWSGVNVDNMLTTIKEASMRAEDELGFVHSNFTLPLHISLKMPFFVDDERSGEIIDSLIELYGTFKPFFIGVKGIENLGNIVWIRMEESKELDLICYSINGMLSEKYGVPIQPYDCDHQFHTTLFMDDDAEKIGAAYEAVKDAFLSDRLVIYKLVIGVSETGELGTFKVLKTVGLLNEPRRFIQQEMAGKKG